MRCAKGICKEDAEDGSNYCRFHLRLTGAPRPGTYITRSGRALDIKVMRGTMRTMRKPGAARDLRSESRNIRILIGKADILSIVDQNTSESEEKGDRRSELAKISISMKKTRKTRKVPRR